MMSMMTSNRALKYKFPKEDIEQFREYMGLDGLIEDIFQKILAEEIEKQRIAMIEKHLDKPLESL